MNDASPSSLTTGVWIMMGLMFLGYFVPGVVAYIRKHENFPAIALLNVLLGWTVVGWVVAMIWALTNRPAQAVNAQAVTVIAAAPQSASRFCAKCGAVFSQSAQYCPSCGTSVSQEVLAP